MCFHPAIQLPSYRVSLLIILDSKSNYKVEGRKILSITSSMKILYVAIVTDPNEYYELLRETLSASLGADIAFAVTSNNQTTQNMYQLFQDK